jgi:hypothetical protein
MMDLLQHPENTIMTSADTKISNSELSSSLASVVWKLCRAQSRRSFESFFQTPAADSGFSESQVGRVLGHIVVAIILQGEGFRLTLKAHSDLAPLREICAKVCGLPLEEVDELRIRDCLREYLNILAGVLQSEMSKVDQECRLSIPISTRGFDELFFGRPSTPIQYQDDWRMEWEGGGRMIMSAFIEFIDLALAEPLLKYDPDAPDEDLFELLSKQGG